MGWNCHYEKKKNPNITFRWWGYGGHQYKTWFWTSFQDLEKDLSSCLISSQIRLINVVDDCLIYLFDTFGNKNSGCYHMLQNNYISYF